MLPKGYIRFITRLILPVLLPFIIGACAASAPPQVVVSTSSEFFMALRRAQGLAAQQDLVRRYPDLARKTFYDHVVLMATDLSYKDLSPVEYDKALQLGRVLANQYELVHGDTQLKETYERMMWDLED